MSRAKTSRELVDDIIGATVALTGYPRDHVKQFVEPALEYMFREYGGDRLPKSTRARAYPVQDILDAIRRKIPRREICRRYAIGTGTLYRVLQEANKARK